MFCLKCKNSELIKKNETFDGEVRGESFKVKSEGMVCPQCGFKTLNPSQMDDFRSLLSEAYRKKYGLLTSGEIVDYRSRLDMTQEEFAEYLGVGVASLKRWELGKIQDPSSDELIRLRSDPNYAAKNVSEVVLKQHLPDHFNGNRHFDLDRFKQVVLLCIEGIPNITLLFLCKLLFYIDFLFFKYFNQSFTGCSYASLELGPCPDQYRELFNKLFEAKIIQHKGKHEFKANVSSDVSNLTEHEKKILNFLIKLFKENPQKYLDLSHEELAWKETPDFQLIDYRLASKLKVSLPDKLIQKHS